jgi:hypothetical protein
MALYYVPQYKSTTLSVAGGIDNSETTGIVLADITGIDDTKPGIACLDWTNPLNTDTAEYITYTSINSGTKELNGVTRGAEGISAKSHNNGCTVAFVFSKSHINNINNKLTGVDVTLSEDTSGNEFIKTSKTTSAVNEITVTNAATTTAPTISATGGDTNIDLKLIGKGTGNAQAYSEYDAQYFDIVPNYSMARQAIINGNFDVWQRGTSVVVVDATPSFIADRWRNSCNDDGGTLPTITVSRQAITAGDLSNSFYHFRVNVNGAGTSLGNSSFGTVAQRIEYGTRFLAGNGKKVTVSFYAKSDIANKKIGVYLNQNYGTGGSPTSQETVTGANWTLTSNWTKYTYTFTTNTLAGKTFGTANDDYLQFVIAYQWGSTIATNVGDTIAETYVGAGNIDIAQVQLCAGEVALPFQPKSFHDELIACKRYYQKSFRYSVAPAQNTGDLVGMFLFNQVVAASTAQYGNQIFFVTPLRIGVTPVTYNPSAANAEARNYVTNGNCSSTTPDYCTEISFRITTTTPAGTTAGQLLGVHWTVDAEL